MNGLNSLENFTQRTFSHPLILSYCQPYINILHAINVRKTFCKHNEEGKGWVNSGRSDLVTRMVRWLQRLLEHGQCWRAAAACVVALSAPTTHSTFDRSLPLSARFYAPSNRSANVSVIRDIIYRRLRSSSIILNFRSLPSASRIVSSSPPRCLCFSCPWRTVLGYVIRLVLRARYAMFANVGL